MAATRQTQKQIAERYKTNLGYYNKLHPWRRARALVSLIALIGGIATIVIFQNFGRETFFSAGKISAPHAGFAQECAKCHERAGSSGKVMTVLSDRFHRGIAFEGIDRKCETCHKQHTLHEPNVVKNRSCSACHQEHQGLAALKLVTSFQCTSCHAARLSMEASANKGMQMQWENYHRHPHPPPQVVFELPRPPRGYTATFESFWNGHPEFQLVRDKSRDPDVLRFNHQRHFAGDVPPVNGKRLNCNYCHVPDAGGRYYQRITFAANCQPCHSLQFDPKNPGLKIPHGDVDLARTFLRTLPAQYANYARARGISRDVDVANFVALQVRQLRETFHSGDELERAVFFTVDPYKPQEKMAAAGRANFIGCAFCHEVKTVANATPAITKPVLIDRWMPHAEFSHAQHQIDPLTQQPLDCNICHRALQSRETSDVLMPAKSTCLTCHSPQGKVAAECITCHTYHAPAAAQTTAAAISAKQMLVGKR
jgi:predicted CXXCH cytochrome family protein